jgi:hypothetical protein
MKSSWPFAVVLTSILVTALVAPPPAAAQGAVQLEFLPSARPQDSNFRLSRMYGFSVARESSNIYRLYSTGPNQRVKWSGSTIADLGWPPETYCVPTEPPYHHNSTVPQWDSRCWEQIGLYWKYDDCGVNNQYFPCRWNGTWHAYPGVANPNISTFPVSWLWPKTTDWGINGFTPVMTKKMVNDPPIGPQTTCTDGSSPCPPRTGGESVCQEFNPDAYSTGVSNSKVVQVGSRWFMAFNTQIRWQSSAAGGHNSSDKWRVAWAYSDDGKNWTPYQTFLFRSSKEGQTTSCGAGLVLTDLFVDGNYFYIVFFEAGTMDVRLARAAISTATRGFSGSWQVAATPLVGGAYQWKAVTLGEKTDFAGLSAASILPTLRWGGTPKQADINRVFHSATPGSPSTLVALTADADPDPDPDDGIPAPVYLQIWTTTSLNKPFTFQSEISQSQLSQYMPVGPWGLEFQMTQHPDNVPATPRLVASQLDLWWVENLSHVHPYGNATVSRKTVRLKGGPFGP